jgi:hypothetical protein
MIIRFELSERSVTLDSLSPYDMGHIEVVGALDSASSKGRILDQAMMIFPSITHLLDGLRTLVVQHGRCVFEFGGIDCSFTLRFEKGKDRRIRMREGKRVLDVSPTLKLCETVLTEASRFVREHRHRLPDADSVALDLDTSLVDFERFVSALRCLEAGKGDI